MAKYELVLFIIFKNLTKVKVIDVYLALCMCEVNASHRL